MYDSSRRRYYLQLLRHVASAMNLVLEVFDSVDSTMDIEPAAVPVAVVAAEQRAGRGRRGYWYSPRGGAWVTIFLKGEPPPGYSVALGGCLAKLLELATGSRIGVKWPNDLVYGDGKLAGILVEKRGGILRVGIGVNVYNDTPHGATSLSVAGYKGPLFLVILAAIKASLEALENTELCLAEAARRDVLRGCRVRVIVEDGSAVEGVGVGLSPEGALLVEEPSSTVRQVYCCHVEWYKCP